MTLRQQAVKAARLAAHESMDMDENLNTIASRVVTAAEPFLRNQVIAEVVGWLRDEAERLACSGQLGDTVAGALCGAADGINKRFGGKP